METLFTLENLINLFLLVMLQAVLGFDNLLYIAIESKRVAPEKQAQLRKIGIALAVILRLILLFAVMEVITTFQGTLFEIDLQGLASGSFNLHSLIVLFGGVFILYTAMKEILHMMSLEEEGLAQPRQRSYCSVLDSNYERHLFIRLDTQRTSFYRCICCDGNCHRDRWHIDDLACR